MAKITQTLLLLLLVITASLAKPLSESQLVDIALVYGNVKYYYPTRSVKAYEWNKQLMYMLQTLETDSLQHKNTANFYQAIEDHYAEMGLHISLYPSCPITENVQPKHAKHWYHKSYGDSKNRFLAGPFAWIYNIFGPYGEKLKRNKTEYYSQMEGSNQLSYNKDELLIYLNDGLWLGLPWSGKRGKKSPGYKNYSADNDLTETTYVYAEKPWIRQGFVIDAWNVIYHYNLQTNESTFWQQRLISGLRDLENGIGLTQVTQSFLAPLEDAHSTKYAYGKQVPGSFYKVDGRIYFKSTTDSISGTTNAVYEVFQYNGSPIDSLYQRYYSLETSQNPTFKAYFALDRMAIAYKDSSLQLTVRNITGTDTSLLQLYYTNFPNDFEIEHSKVETGVINDSLGIYYADLSKTGPKKVYNTLRSNQHHAAIIDARGHPGISMKLIRSMLTDSCTWMTYSIPEYNYPNRNFVVRDTVDDSTKPLKVSKRISTPVAFLIDEVTISHPETMLYPIMNCTNTAIVGRQTAGSTGNIVLAAIYLDKGEIYNIVPFTGMRILNADHSRFTGIYPTIDVPKTLDDVINGNDEILDAAEAYLENLLTQP